MQIYKNLLDESFADFLYNYAESVMYNTNEDNPRVSSNYEWDKYARDDSAPVFTIALKKDIIKQFQDCVQNANIFDPKLHEDLKYVTLYVWTRESYIPLHTDAKYGKTVTVYLNRHWEYKDGGMFHWFDKENDEWKAILPSFNTCLVNVGGIDHATTPVKASDKFRITVQCFIFNK